MQDRQQRRRRIGSKLSDHPLVKAARGRLNPELRGFRGAHGRMVARTCGRCRFSWRCAESRMTSTCPQCGGSWS